MKKIISIYEALYNVNWWTHLSIQDMYLKGKFYKIIFSDNTETAIASIFYDLKAPVRGILPTPVGVMKDEIQIKNALEVAQNHIKWEEILLRKMLPVCQEELLHKMGNDFPWQDSIWEDKDAYEEWADPKNNHNIIAKALEDRFYFEKVRNTDKWKNQITAEKYVYKRSDNDTMQYTQKTLVHFFTGEWAIEGCGFMYPGCGYWATIEECTTEKANKIIEDLHKLQN